MKKKSLVQRAYRAFTHLSRQVDRLIREQLSSCPITVQQCYALESLMEGAKSMTSLAADVAVHQSTLTRIVEKLEKQGLVDRTRKSDNQRMVEVKITETGKKIYLQLHKEALKTISVLLDQYSRKQQKTLVDTMETFSALISPDSAVFTNILQSCCKSECNEFTFVSKDRGHGTAAV